MTSKASIHLVPEGLVSKFLAVAEKRMHREFSWYGEPDPKREQKERQEMVHRIANDLAQQWLDGLQKMSVLGHPSSTKSVTASSRSSGLESSDHVLSKAETLLHEYTNRLVDEVRGEGRGGRIKCHSVDAYRKLWSFLKDHIR